MHSGAALLLWLALPAAASPLEAEVAQVIDLFYDLQFDKAREAADALRARHPGHPAGPFYQSIVSYQRFLVEEPKSPLTLAAFERDNAQARRDAKALLAASPAQGHYYLGIAHGFRARVLAAQRRYVAAIPEALRGIRHLKRALGLDPGLEDAYMGLGMYHYFTARLPAGAKPFAYLLGGVWGDRDLGLEQIHRTAERGGPARMEARSVLSAIYASDAEKNWGKAEAYLEELMDRYPRNPLYRLRRVYVAQRREEWDRALALADPGGEWLSALDPSVRPAARASALYRAAESLLLSGKPERAEPLLRELEEKGAPEPFRGWVALRRANLLDAHGRRDQALAAYGHVDQEGAAKLAREFLRTPYPGGPRDVKPWTGVETPR